MSGTEPPSAGGETSGNDALEYATLIIAVIGEDISRVHVRVTAALGLAAVVVTQLPLDKLQALSDWWRVTTVAGIGSVVAAGVFLFSYTQMLNQARIAIADRVPDEGLRTVAKPWSEHFAVKKGKYLRLYTLGQAFLALGGLALGAVIARLLLD